MIDNAEFVTCSGITVEQGTHFECHSIMSPAGMKPARPGTFRDGRVEHMGRVPGIHPTGDYIIGYRFRKKLCAALTAAATGIVLLPRGDFRLDLLDVKSRTDVLVGVNKDVQLFLCLQ